MSMRYGTSWRRAVWGGVVAGIVAGAVLTVFMAMLSMAADQGDVWRGVKFAGMPFLGDRAAQPGFDATAVLVGLTSHFVVSIAWGVLFALLVRGFSRPATVVLGALYGFVVWIGMFYLVLPLVGMPDVAEGVPRARAALEHVLFGFVVGLVFAPFQRPRAAVRYRPGRTAPVVH